ncbi:hypothetical protein AB0F17_32540 [Nonomuraea sp. NPDC026600]|uniref:hypothetical protein n=1 Tax=Nonomuraea sp. NPDC026600 TaxID=3155363 RepID=UPI0033C9D995
MTRDAVTTKAAHSFYAAERLHAALDDLGIAADVHTGYGIALVSVWVDLVVWSDGHLYWWWSGRRSRQRGRWLYLVHSADDPAAAARRVAVRYGQLRECHPLSALIAEIAS